MAGYEWEQLRKALSTAEAARVPEDRERALGRAESWIRVISGAALGRTTVGSRRPVQGFPAWVTPEVVRGGFVTGEAIAAGPLSPDELALAELVGVRPAREELFRWFLSSEGLQELSRMLDAGDYRVEVPEHGALLVVAYLARNGFEANAESVVSVIEPWSDRLRFWPIPVADMDLPGVHVATVPEVAERLAQKRAHSGVEAEREALGVWAPFTDKLVKHWWNTRSADGRIGEYFPDGWDKQAEQLVLEYRELASTHSRTTKHRDPGGSLQILLGGLINHLDGPLVGTSIVRVRTAIGKIVEKRGGPGSPELRVLREAQSQIVQVQSHAVLAHDAANILRATGLEISRDPLSLLDGSPGAHLPSVRSVARQATHASVSTLLRGGIVRSAEMLADLAPQLTADIVAGRYQDPTAQRLAKRVYAAFSNRRSVLLLNLESQVDVSEIPWFATLERTCATDRGADLARLQASELASLAMKYFAGTPVPNSMIRELSRLTHSVGDDVPFTYELAADIFAGSFSPVFQRAAQRAAIVVEDTIYSKYYNIDYARISLFETVTQPLRQGFLGRPRVSAPDFDALVKQRAGVTESGWLGVAGNGTIIEQAQILTTQNLALLVQLGVELDWLEQARAAWRATRHHLAKMGESKPLHHRKNAAFAWRQVVFYLALSHEGDIGKFLNGSLMAGASAEVAASCEVVLSGLRDVITKPESVSVPFLGWVERSSG